MCKNHETHFVSVIVPTYHDWGRLSLCLNALNQQTYPKTKFEIIVINNDPLDLPPQEIKIPENCKVVQESMPGSYAARNKGISTAKGRVLAFTDSDCIPQHDWLETALLSFYENPACSRVAGPIKFFADKKKGLGYFYEKVFGLDQKLYVEKRGSAATANVFAKREVFDAVGKFDQSLMSGGDILWGELAEKSGYRIVFNENSAVKHPARNVSEIINKVRRTTGGIYKISRKKGRASLFLSFLLLFIPPVKSIARALFVHSLSPYQKLQVILFRCFLRWIAISEFLLLWLGTEARRS